MARSNKPSGPDGAADSAGSRLDFRVLGPLQVVRRGEVLSLGGPRQRAVLALLLLHDRFLPIDFMVDQLWDGNPPPTARATLRSYLSNLRRLLRAETSGSGPLVSEEPGYALRIRPEQLDARRFEGLVGVATSRLAEGRPVPASEAPGRAPGPWR